MAYPTVAEIRERVPALAEAGAFPDLVIQDLIDEFAEIAEDYCGVAFISRTATETLIIDCYQTRKVLAHPKVASITSLVVDGVTIAATSYRLLLDGATGVIVYDTGFAPRTTAVITYPHGYATTPKVISRACREYVRSCALSDASSVPRDVISMTGPSGVTTRYSSPNISQGRPTGWTGVDYLLNMAPSFRGVGIG